MDKTIGYYEALIVREYLGFSLIMEKSVYSLHMDIQGRFVKNTSDIHTKTYKILSDIIDNKAKHIAMLEKTFRMSRSYEVKV